jgi:hypothetical protein
MDNKYIGRVETRLHDRDEGTTTKIRRTSELLPVKGRYRSSTPALLPWSSRTEYTVRGTYLWCDSRGDFDYDAVEAEIGIRVRHHRSTRTTQDQVGEEGYREKLGSVSSSNNEKLAESGRRAFFDWISADDEIATARGGGGGLALWKRVVD